MIANGPVLGEHAGSIADLGLLTRLDGDQLVGTAVVIPELFVPGTTTVRTSVLATWADVVAGKFANSATQPRICVTLDLDLYLVRSPSGVGFAPGDEIEVRAGVVRSGRRVTVMGYEARNQTDDAPFAFGHAGFMASPDPAHEVPDVFPLESSEARRRLALPFADRVGVRRGVNGQVEVPYRIDNVNATGAIQGGLVALAAEEAVLAARRDAEFASLSIRYLSGIREVAAVATADMSGDLARVEIVAGDAGKLGAVATAQLRPNHRPTTDRSATGEQ